MHRLLYTSQLAEHGKALSKADIARLAAAAAERNREQDITGALMLVDGTFVQVLEGRFAYLEDTFERICCDFRHTNLRLIDLLPIEKRMFGEWSMAFLGTDEDVPEHFTECFDRIQFLVGTNVREAVLQMRALLDDKAFLRTAA